MPQQLHVAPDRDDWTPPDYQQPDQDDVTIDREHPHPAETDQKPED